MKNYTSKTLPHIKDGGVHLAVTIILIAVMLIGSAASLTGCGNYKTRREREKEIEEKSQLTLDLLKEKYNEDFEIIKPYYDGGFNAFCRPINNPRIIFDVYVPKDEISRDTYLHHAIARKYQEKCNDIFKSMDFDFYCAPIIFRINEKKEAESIKNVDYDSIDLINDITDSDFLVAIYIPVEYEYNTQTMYQSMLDVISLASINSGAIGFYFVDDEEMIKVKNYYENGLLVHLMSANTGGRTGVGIDNFNTLNCSFSYFSKNFEETQTKATDFYKRFRSIK